MVLPIFAALYHWFPKFTGRRLDERLGRWHFWLFLVGLNVAFFTMHITGFEGMPRRVYTYLPGLGWDTLNLVSTVGAVLMGLGTAVFVWNLARSWRWGERVGLDPWAANTLEWAASSPPAKYNFRSIPLVSSRDPLWDPVPAAQREPEAAPGWLQELRDAPEDLSRQTVLTTVLDAEPDGVCTLPGPSLVPLWLALALAVSFIGAIASLAFVPVGLALAFGVLLAWHWPGPPPTGRRDPVRSGELQPPTGSDELPRHIAGVRSPILWGVGLLIAIETTVMLLFSTSYFYLALGAEQWPPAGIDAPDLWPAALGLGLLLMSPIPPWIGVRALRRGRREPLLIAIPAGMLLAAGYLAVQVIDFQSKDYDWTTDAYGSTMLMRTTGRAQPLIPTIRRVVQEELPGMAIDDIRTVAEIEAEERKVFNLATATLAGAGFVALSCQRSASMRWRRSLGQRTGEIAVRLVFGARARQIVGRFVADGLRLSVLGMIAGLPLSLIGLRTLFALRDFSPPVPLSLVTAMAAVVFEQGVALFDQRSVDERRVPPDISERSAVRVQAIALQAKHVARTHKSFESRGGSGSARLPPFGRVHEQEPHPRADQSEDHAEHAPERTRRPLCRPKFRSRE